jgi:membrane associated rhomboid family serine protease
MTPWVTRLIVANIIVYLLQISLPGVTELFALVPAYLLQRPWTILTYMFTHSRSGISHIAFNMLALWIFGPRVEQRLGGPTFIRLYLLSGISGGLLSLLFTPFSAIVGASGAIFGVQLAFAKFFPRERIYIWGVIPVEARMLVIIMTALSVFGGFSGGGSTAHFAHLGGYVGAFLYLAYVQRRSPATQWEQKVAGPPPGQIPLGNWRGVDLGKVHELNRDEVQRILDKLTASGEGSLTSQEKVFLGHFIPKG